jgi:copper transport protein
MSLRGIFLCLALIVLAVSSAPREAMAHAALVTSEPAAGSVLAAAPDRVRLIFSEPVAPLVFRLLSPGGSPVDLPDVSSDGARLTLPLPPDLAQGTHLVSWRVVSEDGHPIGGTLSFSVGAASAAPSVGAAEDRPFGVTLGLWFARVGLYSALFLGVGGVFFAAWSSRSPLRAGALRRVLTSLLGLGVASALVGLGWQGLDALGVSLSALARRDVWATGLETSFGRTAILAMIGSGLGILALRAASLRTRRALASVAMLAPGLALAATGHASAAEPQLMMRPLVFLHASAIAWWAGALLPLAFALRADRGRTALVRFSTRAPFVFAVLFLSGVVIAIVQMGAVDAFWTTTYGRVLALKLGAVALVLGLAVHNRYVLTRPVLLGDERATRRLVRSIATELILVVVVFGLAASWRFTPPPRALARALPPIELHLHGQKAMAEFILTPRVSGAATVDIEPLDTGGVPFKPQEVTVSLAPAGGGIEPIRMQAQPGEDGRWRASVAGLAGTAEWTVRVDLLISDFDKAMLEGRITLSASP